MWDVQTVGGKSLTIVNELAQLLFIRVKELVLTSSNKTATTNKWLIEWLIVYYQLFINCSSFVIYSCCCWFYNNVIIIIENDLVVDL